MTHGLFAVHWSKSIQTWHIFSLPDGRPVPELKLYCGTLNGNCNEPRLGSKYMYIIAMPKAQGGKALVLQYPLDSITREADPVLRYKPAATNDDIKRVFQHAGLDWADDTQVWDLKLGNKTMHLNISDFCTYNHVQRPRVGTDADIEAWHKHVADVKIMAFEHKIQNTTDPSFDASRFRANPVLPPSETEQNCLKVDLQKDGYSVQKPDERICPTQAESDTAAEQQEAVEIKSEVKATPPTHNKCSEDDSVDAENTEANLNRSKYTRITTTVIPTSSVYPARCWLDMLGSQSGDRMMLIYHVCIDSTNVRPQASQVICWALASLQEVIARLEGTLWNSAVTLREDLVAKILALYNTYNEYVCIDECHMPVSAADLDQMCGGKA